VIEWGPPERLEVENVALPLFSVSVPSAVPPSKNVTVPLAWLGETVAVNVIGCPRFDGLRLDASVVVVLVPLPVLTVWVRTADVLALRLVLPP